MRFSPLYWLIVVGVFSLSTLGIAMSQIPLPPGRELSELLKNVEQLNQALEKDPKLLNGTRLKDVDLSGLVLKDITLKSLHWRNIQLEGVQWSNVTIEKADWFGVVVKKSNLENIIFRQVHFNQDEDVRWGSSSFIQSRLHNVHYIDSKLVEVRFNQLNPGYLHFERSTLKTAVHQQPHWQRKGVMINSVLKLHIKDSDFETETIFNLENPSEAYIENSKVVGGIGGELKRLEIRSSYYKGKGGDKTDYVFVEDSEIRTGFPEANFIHLKNNTYLTEKGSSIVHSLGMGKVQTAIIDGCRSPIYFSLTGNTKLQNLSIRHCQLNGPYFSEAQIGEFELCDSSIELRPGETLRNRPYAWDEANIRELNLHNVKFEGDFPEAKDLQIGILGSDGQHPIPGRLQQAADEQKTLNQCPPLPDIEALKQQALNPEQAQPLADILNALSSDSIELTRLNPDPEVVRGAHPLQCIYADRHNMRLTFDPDWLKSHYSHYSLSAMPVPPPVSAATLTLYDESKKRIINVWPYQTIPKQSEAGQLQLQAVCDIGGLFLSQYFSRNLSSLVVLDMWFNPAQAPLSYQAEKPWRTALWLESEIRAGRTQQEHLETRPWWRYSWQWVDIPTPTHPVHIHLPAL